MIFVVLYMLHDSITPSWYSHCNVYNYRWFGRKAWIFVTSYGILFDGRFEIRISNLISRCLCQMRKYKYLLDTKSNLLDIFWSAIYKGALCFLFIPTITALIYYTWEHLYPSLHYPKTISKHWMANSQRGLLSSPLPPPRLSLPRTLTLTRRRKRTNCIAARARSKISAKAS